MRAVITSFIFLFTLNTFAQSDACGFNWQMLDSGNQAWYSTAVDHANHPHSKRSSSDTVFTVKVIFHLIYPTYTITSKAQFIPNHIQQVQLDFRRLNADTVNLRSIYRDRVGDARIQFVLADSTPDGKPCQGYTFTKSSKIFGVLLGASYSTWHNMKFDSLGGKNAWDTRKYLNVWVCNNVAPNGEYYYGAFATPPKNAPNWSSTYWADSMTDGVVMGYASYEMWGRRSTLTHEIGHYLGLRHVSGDAPPISGGDCKLDDFIFDTPKISTANFNCDKSVNTCDEGQGDLPDMLENYMDYTSCRNTFTMGQIRLMRYCLSTLRYGLSRMTISKTPSSEAPVIILIYTSTTSHSIIIKHQDTLTEPLNVQVYNAIGQCMASKDLTQSEFSLSTQSWSTGLYTVLIRNTKGNVIKIEKVLVD
jgi:hypothetical protein